MQHLAQRWLLDAGTYSGLGASLAFAGLSMQLLVGVLLEVRPTDEPESVPMRVYDPATDAPSDQNQPSAKSAAAAEELEDEEEARHLRLTLSVMVGYERAEVFVNSRRVGFTPYFGDYSCLRDEKLIFEIVPETGPLIVRRALCQGKSLRIRD